MSARRNSFKSDLGLVFVSINYKDEVAKREKIDRQRTLSPSSCSVTSSGTANAIATAAN
jgi:hypothetical protein